MDITKCSGEGCPMKESCLRFLVEESRWQSYFSEPPIDGDICEDYVKEEEE